MAEARALLGYYRRFLGERTGHAVESDQHQERPELASGPPAEGFLKNLHGGSGHTAGCAAEGSRKRTP